jgi:hypothetical protein
VLKRLQAFISYGDPPPPLSPAADASGIAKVTLKWGDRTPPVTLKLGRHRSFHTYLKPGRYKVTVTVSDKAGNTTRTVTTVDVKPTPKKKSKKKPKKKPPASHSRVQKAPAAAGRQSLRAHRLY